MRSKPMPVSTCLAGSGRQFPVGVAVVLDEDQVPDFHDAGVFAVDVFAAGFVRGAVDVDFGAGSAGAGVAHLPEIVFAEIVDVIVGHAGDLFPEVGGFGVAGDAVFFVAFVAGDVQAGGVEFPDLGEEFPGHFDGAAFEVIAEAPVAEHFEEGVMAAGAADVVEIVVFAAGADAFLGVGGAGVGAFFLAEEDRLELIHAGVGEEQRGIVLRDDGRGGNEGVAVLLDEEIEELLADLGGGHGRCRVAVGQALVQRWGSLGARLREYGT